MELLTIPALHQLIAILRRYAPKLDGSLVNLVAVGLGIVVAYLGVNILPGIEGELSEILSGVTLGLGASGFDAGLKAVNSPGYATLSS